MSNETIKNRILEIPSFISKNNENALQTKEDSVYMEVDESVISNLISTGYLVADLNRSNCWSRGSNSKFFYNKRKILVEAKYITVRVKENEDICIEDLAGIWIIKDDTGKYVNKLEYLLEAYMEQKNNKERNHR